MPDEQQPQTSPAEIPFEKGLDELEKIVREMESADLPLERALQLFERGMALSESCRKQLDEAETRVEILMQRGDRIVAKPFEPKS